MPIERPTFSQSWYRVSELTPRLVGAVKVHRQHFRGIQWYVLQDPANNQFFRLSDAAYHFVAMLDGRRTVNQVWRTCMEEFGDNPRLKVRSSTCSVNSTPQTCCEAIWPRMRRSSSIGTKGACGVR
jgi:hypothetical protein